MAITPVRTLVAQAKSEITTLPADAVQQAVAAGTALMVDIRDIRELEREGRIPGAFHAPRGMLEFWVDPESPYHKPALGEGRLLVLFCASAWRSALAAKTLQDMGVENVAELDGGFKGWDEGGHPVER
ncbi:rhodanese-like domain-containing protein [Pseudoruegeria sp. SHC-113]|uniref:rhodanese-like domain-containing protein n=1 Tax=Pseudoruegeria sp. SHC-113 TaxID=2855439 RepID=UPI0021BAEA53|nr:rhodanese-like domain-containing protein [Pseudoruegeria sp. SHC-113]MCT8158465.1 rhodanese-like domain-containing protein [Pseudoruegeria sp. SHC-113]